MKKKTRNKNLVACLDDANGTPLYFFPTTSKTLEDDVTKMEELAGQKNLSIFQGEAKSVRTLTVVNGVNPEFVAEYFATKYHAEYHGITNCVNFSNKLFKKEDWSSYRAFEPKKKIRTASYIAIDSNVLDKNGHPIFRKESISLRKPVWAIDILKKEFGESANLKSLFKGLVEGTDRVFDFHMRGELYKNFCRSYAFCLSSNQTPKNGMKPFYVTDKTVNGKKLVPHPMYGKVVVLLMDCQNNFIELSDAELMALYTHMEKANMKWQKKEKAEGKKKSIPLSATA